jgi:Pyridoxamine 5''-phosphate oxidase.
MFESDAEIAEMQRLFDDTLRRANSHMVGIVTLERRLSARQVAAYLLGTRHVAFATVTAKGEPRVSPLDSLFIHGRFTMGTGGEAARLRHLRANPACSAAYMEGDRIAVVVNGTVEWIGRDHPDHAEVHATWEATYGSDPYSLEPGVTLFRIAPASMWAFASRPEDFPEG